jgi:hypothetical protein
MPPGTDVDRQTPSRAGELRVGTGHESRRFLVANMNEANLLFGFTTGFHNSVNVIASRTKDGINTPGKKTLNKNI